MSAPFAVGETVYKAYCARTGIRIVAGKVIYASEGMFLVEEGERHESLPQDGPAGWCRTRFDALDHLVCVLGASLRKTEADVQRIKGRIRNAEAIYGQMSAQGVPNGNA